MSSASMAVVEDSLTMRKRLCEVLTADPGAATEYIMAHCPTPILIVSSSTNRGELFKTYEALAAGAVDVLEKPRGDETDDEWERQFVSTVKLVSKIKVITHPRARLRNLGRLPSKDLTPLPREAIERGAACRVLPLYEIGPVLAGLSMEATQP